MKIAEDLNNTQINLLKAISNREKQLSASAPAKVPTGNTPKCI